jgi:AraC-like DNA-binding protein
MPKTSKNAIALTAEFMELVLDLLEATDREMARDRSAARQHLGRATALVRAERDALKTPPRESPGSLAFWKRRLILLHIEENLSRTITLGELAALAQFSPSYFVRTFKLAFEETPAAYVNRRRVARSMQMMLESDEPLSQIALACGLSDQAHLSRLFRQAYGVSPARWRRLRREALKSAVPVEEGAASSPSV